MTALNREVAQLGEFGQANDNEVTEPDAPEDETATPEDEVDEPEEEAP